MTREEEARRGHIVFHLNDSAPPGDAITDVTAPRSQRALLRGTTDFQATDDSSL